MHGKGKILAAVLVAALLWGCHQAPSPEPSRYTLPPSPYTWEDFFYEGNYLACSAAEVSVGIDVSHHQGIIDWKAVADSGVEFAIIRLGYRGLGGGELHADDYVQENLQGARSAGLKIGAYFFSQAVSVAEAREEAACALQLLDGLPLELPLVFDWEQETRNADVDIHTATDCAIAFCEDVKAAGYDPMVYFNSYQAQHLMDMERLEDYPWWLAMYDVRAEFPCRMDLWQYTNTGSVPGIDGNVDINLMFPAEPV